MSSSRYCIQKIHKKNKGIKYKKLVVEELESMGKPYKTYHIKTLEEAKGSPNPFTTYSVYYNGKFITNEILTVKKLHQIIEKYN